MYVVFCAQHNPAFTDNRLGIFDTRIVSLGIVDTDKGDHVYCGVRA